MNQEEYFSSDSDVLDLDLARIEYKVQQGKRGHVSYASLKVISLIGAWTNIALLGFIIAAIVVFFTLLPDNISLTLNNWILFLRSITDGYKLARQNLPPSQATSTLKDDFSNALRMFYDIPFPRIRNTFNNKLVQTLFPILAEVPTIAYNVHDMLWFVTAIWRFIFKVTSPTEYIFPSDRYYPFTVIFNDKNDTHGVNGEFIDLSSSFPGLYEKHNNNMKYTIGFDQLWYMYQIISSEPATASMRHFGHKLPRSSLLNVISLQFYEPLRNELIILNKNNDSCWTDANGLFSLRFIFDSNVNTSYWQLSGENGMDQKVTYIQPFSNLRQGQQCPEGKFQVHADTIEVSVTQTPNAFNGIYRKIKPEEQWRSRQYGLYDLGDQMEGLSTYIKVDKRHKYHWTYYKLTHMSKHTHEFELTSHQITKLYESRGKENVAVSINSVKWNRLKIGQDKMEPQNDIHAKIKMQDAWQAPDIQKVILRYKHPKYDMWHTALCIPYLKFQDDGLYFKLRTESNRIDHIVAGFHDVDINDTDCKTKIGFSEAYLKVTPFKLKSEVLGGENIDGSADVFFRNVDSCNKWRTLYIKTLDDMAKSSKLSQRKNMLFLNQQINKFLDQGTISSWGKTFFQTVSYLTNKYYYKDKSISTTAN